ncbi:sensor histidine kinase [Marinifilum sp. RC60d5]|uniref:sensor histidine kinase n=1 Tax=Marinifilum sp. RC60d5 TaxID=3458414 RepID=UPI0040374689
MILQVALILSVLLQFGAFFITINLIPKTRFNVSWIMISIGFLLMAVRRCIELVQLWNAGVKNIDLLLSNWIAVFISLLMFFGAFYIRRIFKLQDKIDKLRKESEAKVLNAILKTEEKERQKFAKELHDGLGPILSNIKMTLSAINKSQENEKNLVLLEKSDQATNEAILSVKEISNKLSPHLLERYGLEKAIKTFINNIHLPDKLEVILNLQVEKLRFDYNIELVIYRVIGELINNTIKHANASRIELTLLSFHKKLQLIYCDNGKGFSRKKEINGMGIANMKSRIKSLDGSFELSNKIQNGFYLKIEIPEK